MAFPDDVTVFTQAQDPSTTLDAENISAYQALIESGDYASASALLASMTKGIEMNMNAGRFNEVLAEIQAIETFYLSLNGVRAYIQENIDKYTDINVWNDTTDYAIGNIASNDGDWYICTTANGVSTTIYEPNVTSGWESYWDVFLAPKPAEQYPIQTAQPTGQAIGDLWFEVIE
jgi:alkyl hydroperoxide reductase subunit AhpF